jgi:hypothetical protein
LSSKSTGLAASRWSRGQVLVARRRRRREAGQPVRPLGILQWLFSYPSYILPWNLLYAAIAVAVWTFLTPPVETLQTFAPGWIAFVFACNLCLVVLFFGAFHLRL